MGTDAVSVMGTDPVSIIGMTRSASSVLTRARVIGAGLSGLTAAWWLAEAGFDVEIIEAGQRTGGLIHTIQTTDGLVETAANAFVWTDTAAEWFARLELQPHFARPTSRRRFIFRDGRPRRWPLTAAETLQGARRLGGAWIRARMAPDSSETIAAWSDRVLGKAATQWLVSPGLQGIYAAAADQLSAAAILAGRVGPRGFMKSSPAPRAARRRTIAAPAGGMGTFVDRLTAKLAARGVTFQFGVTLDRLEPGVPTIVCTNARSAESLVAPVAPELAAALRAVSMTSVVTVTAFFEPSADDLHGFGVLFPRDTEVRALGVLFNNDIFDDRSPLRSETWIHGAVNESPVPSDVELRGILEADRRVLTGRTAAPVSIHPTRVVPALPVYGRGVLDIKTQLTRLPCWLALAGNYTGRIGVSALLEGAREAADRLASAQPRVVTTAHSAE